MSEKFVVYLDEKNDKGEETMLHISDGVVNINISVPVGEGVFEAEIVKFARGLREALVRIYEYRIKREISSEIT